MKKSLKKAISLFPISEQILIFVALICFKLKLKVPQSAAVLFSSCNDYVRMTEQAVDFTKESKELIKASLFINQHPITVFLRRLSSDRHVLESVLLHEEYKVAVEKLQANNHVEDKVIIDAGGNIGLTTIYLHSFFPKAKFVIIEPDENNAALLEKNLQANEIQSATVTRKALWISNEKLVLDHSFRDGKEWSISVGKINSDSTQVNDHQIEGINLQEICLINGIQLIDLLKIDIEGAERFLFVNDSFLKTVSKHAKHLIIEIHDEFKIRETINQKMLQLGFTRAEQGDVTLFAKQ